MKRNLWCPQYARCLDQTIESGAGGFSCRGCQHRGDHGGRPAHDADARADAAACLALLVVIFGYGKVGGQQAMARMD